MWGAIKAILERPIPVWGHVTDAQTGLPVSVSITYPQFPFPNGETNPNDPVTGRYHAFLPPEGRTLLFSAPGYRDAQIALLVRPGVSQEVDVAMIPDSFCPSAAVTTRTTPINPNLYTVSAPVIGQPVTFTVNTLDFRFVVIFANASPDYRFVPVGSIALVDFHSPSFFTIGPLMGPNVQTQMVITTDPSLCGLTMFTQARVQTFAGADSRYRLTNSQDLLLGF